MWFFFFSYGLLVTKHLKLSIRLDTDETPSICVYVSFFFFFLELCFYGFMSHQWVPCTIHETHKPLFFNNFFIKNGSNGTIYKFKNYFTTIFSIFNKINGI